MENGYVKMKLEDYRELMLENVKLKTAFIDTVSNERHNSLKLANLELEEQLANSVPLEEYNRVVDAITIRKDWFSSPEVVIDLSQIADILADKLSNTEFAESHKFKELGPKVLLGVLTDEEEQIDQA